MTRPSNHRTRHRALLAKAAVLGGLSLLGACATPDASPSAAEAAPGFFYRCDAQFSFTVRFIDGTAVVDSGLGREVLRPVRLGNNMGGTILSGTAFENLRVRIDFDPRPAPLAPRVAGQPVEVVSGRALVRFTRDALAIRCARAD